MTVLKVLLLVSVLAVVGKASPVADSPFDVTFADDGTVTIASTKKNVPTAEISLWKHGARAAVTEDCVADAPNSICKQGSNIRSEFVGDYACLTSHVITDDPAIFYTTFNLTGHIYGGPEQKYQYWPLDDVVFDDYSYVTKELDAQGVADPYWLSSEGYFIYVYPETHLFIDQNTEYDHFFRLVSKNEDPYPLSRLHLKFTICKFDNAKEAHKYAVQNYLGKPTGIPDERMIKYPIWSTWARYKTAISEAVVQEFADEIIEYGFENSQLEIDDFWETCYGSLTFDTRKFPDMKRHTDDLKSQGYRVTLWIHPFVNLDCEPFHQEGLDKGYFVKNTEGNTTTTWWNGVASIVDFTNPEAVDWWVDRLKSLKEENGIDSFKFDAGETSWMPQVPVLSGDQELLPNLYTERYVDAVSQFGDMIEVRVGHHTQDRPVFVRMLDKDSRWDIANGLPTLITTLLEMNMVGYPHVLPDMVGGNGYQGAPDKELFIRWLQANVFMPAIQYSYVPWDYDEETIEISLKFTKLHAEYAPKIIELLKKAVEDGTPANPPIWWIDPTDEVAQEISDEYLLGEDLLVAPVIEQGAVSRDIYLPRGLWRDEATPSNGVFEGPTWLYSYSAPLDTLPYFSRQG